MSLSNEIVLRPRFKFDVKLDNESLLNHFETTKKTQKDFIVSRIDDHVFIKIPKAKQHFWSPQLHLEINKNENNTNSTIYGLFGPNPTVWTMFMFFHFIVIGLFFGFGVWAYTNWSLETNYSLQLAVTLFMIIVWFALYFGGRIGKKTGTAQMYELHTFMRDTLRSKGIHAETN
ncbi:GTP-binding protein [Oceanihabitans sp. 2_MG-2023]|uniref:GTP-binding protein n=1 Tax=Oceanihabitans sp. 2_MG-2023 TaxID=3062661 RepID=UPI0026E45589|nr:GTP-binding protein [Oceanihabitans sp. 2_MG-2023]MDO6596120.1 GTP-binding protein [Oceanihabitans sp. 2_MG-2023]